MTTSSNEETDLRVGCTVSAGGRSGGRVLHAIVVPKGMNSGRLLCRSSSRGVAIAQFKDAPVWLALNLNMGCTHCMRKLNANAG